MSLGFGSFSDATRRFAIAPAIAGGIGYVAIPMLVPAIDGASIVIAGQQMSAKVGLAVAIAGGSSAAHFATDFVENFINGVTFVGPTVKNTIKAMAGPVIAGAAALGLLLFMGNDSGITKRAGYLTIAGAAAVAHFAGDSASRVLLGVS